MLGTQLRTERRRKLLVAGIAVVGALALFFAFAARGENRPVRLRVVIEGAGTVNATPGSRRCRRSCDWAFAKGAVARLRPQPARGERFVGWSGGCSGRAGCAVKMTKPRLVHARFQPSRTLASWNEHVRCTPVLTTVATVIGSEQAASGGATERGGRFQPHLRGESQKHLLDPPCAIEGTPTFVELHGVVVSDREASGDGDFTANLTDPSRAAVASQPMGSIYAEIDTTWFAAKVAPPLLPANGTKIDVQGFIFWDTAHTDADWHSFSGWELHPVSAWRLSSARR